MTKLVSIIITTYGRKSEFKRALLSVLQQTHKDIEIIVIDDNVKEEYSVFVVDIIKELGDKRIKYYKNKENLGAPLSRNMGIKRSKAEYIAFLDDDDEYLPEKVEKQLAVFENDEAEKLGLVYCYCDGVKDGKVVEKYRYDYVGGCLYEAMIICIAATSQWMCRKEALLSVNGFTDMPCKQDSYLILKLLAEGFTVDRVPEVLSLYYDDEIPRISSKTAEKRIIGETMLRDLCRQNYDKISKKQQKEVEYVFARALVIQYARSKKWSESCKMLKRIFRIHPLRVRSYKSLIKWGCLFLHYNML